MQRSDLIALRERVTAKGGFPKLLAAIELMLLHHEAGYEHERHPAVRRYCVQSHVARTLFLAAGTAEGFVYMHTNRFNGDPYSHISACLALPFPTSDTGELVGAAIEAAARAFRPGFRYAKSGVELVELMAADKVQPDLFSIEHHERRRRLMQALDAVNGKYGRDVLFPAAMGIPKARTWSTRAERKSPCYTTELGSVPVARA